MSKHETIGVFDYQRNKLCDLYDSQNDLVGQAYGIKVTTDWNGTHTLEFNIPYVIDASNSNIGSTDDAIYGSGIYGKSRYGVYSKRVNHNFRWDFLKSDYVIRYTCGSKNLWFVANKPQKAKSGKKIYGAVTCYGFENLLKTRNIYMSFDDENGIGTIGYLIAQILKGTGWTFDANGSDTMYERDGVTEKIRSLKSDGKKGAIDLITTVCNLFEARPVYDADTMTVSVKAINNRQQVLEGEVGRNLSAMTVSHDSTNIATRVYVEGEYGDYGYVGIDDVLVDENGDLDDNGDPYGLPFMMNFDYYRSIGVFTQENETALATYIEDIKAIKAAIRENGLLLIAADDQINNMIGQCRMALYYKDESLVTPKYTYGGITEEEAALAINDDVVILKNNNTHTYEKWTGNPVSQLDGAYGVAKFATKSAGKIGAAEVQIEAKEKEITQLQRKIDVTVKPDKIAEYEAEIDRLEEEIEAIYNGDENTGVDGLYKMMSDVMKSTGMLYQFSHYDEINTQLNEEQDDIEATFIAAMGYMLRDGYWNNTNYTVGQEKYLYEDARDIINEMSKPVTNYTFSYVRITEDFDVPAEDIEINAIFKLYDRELDVDDKMFIKKITYGVDDKKLGSIEVSNQDITLTGNDLGTLLSRMSQLADLIDQKNALYERAKALTNEGSIYSSRLEGAIDAAKTQLLSSVSNWHTDDSGNIVFEASDGSGAMMLCGAGFMIASGKDDQGQWDWRCFGTGRGFTAEEIIAGFISADRIEAGSIQASKLASDVGSSLDLSSNVALNAYINNSIDQKVAEMQLTPEQFEILFNDTVKDDIDSSISGVQTDLNDYQTEVANYMRYDNTGTLTLGKANNEFTTQIDNTKMSFKQGNAEVAYISNQSMYITNARVTEQLSLGTNNGYGYFDWVVTPTGLGLKWRNTAQ